MNMLKQDIAYDISSKLAQDPGIDFAHACSVEFSSVVTIFRAELLIPLQNCSFHQEWPLPTAFTRSQLVIMSVSSWARHCPKDVAGVSEAIARHAG